ncbi:DUF5615 family PIN-like protein [Neolewinella antarctica]
MPLLLADENLPASSFRLLLHLGYDIRSIARESAGVSDPEVVQIAIKEQRIILTFDSDFGELIYRYGLTPPGVVYFRLVDYTPSMPGRILHDLLLTSAIDVTGHMTVISQDLLIRQRKIIES